jgi:hypothetical protein
VGTKRENRYWTGGEERRCRMCHEERERNEGKGEKGTGMKTEGR